MNFNKIKWRQNLNKNPKGRCDLESKGRQCTGTGYEKVYIFAVINDMLLMHYTQFKLN